MNNDLIQHFQEVGDDICVLYLEGRYKEHKNNYTVLEWFDAMLRIDKVKTQ